jgi:hypothetical protein
VDVTELIVPREESIPETAEEECNAHRRREYLAGNVA